MQATIRNNITTLGVTALLLAPLCGFAHAEDSNANTEYDWLIGDVLPESESTLFDQVIRDLNLDFAADTSSTNGDDVLSSNVPQDGSSSAAGSGDGKYVDKSDQTGTNPINFTYDLRVYNEFQWLNTAGDGDQNITTTEYRMPFADGKWQFRVRARSTSISADINDDGIDDLDESGFGDMDFRLLTVPYMNMSKKIAIATGLEVFLDTASEDALGTGSTSLGPQVFVVFFKPFLDLTLFAPAYQHIFDIDGNTVNQSLIDLFFLQTSEDKTIWVLVDPQIILDYENNTEFLLLDVEVGTMLDKYIDKKGHSVYVRPSAGIGSDRPYDASIELGYKVVW